MAQAEIMQCEASSKEQEEHTETQFGPVHLGVFRHTFEASASGSGLRPRIYRSCRSARVPGARKVSRLREPGGHFDRGEPSLHRARSSNKAMCRK